MPHHRKYPVREDYFNIWSSSMAYILGFVTADGCISRERGNLEISLQSADVEVLEFIRDEISPTRPIGFKTVTLQTTRKTYGQRRLQIFSTKLVDSLIKLGVVPKKTGREMVPPFLPVDLTPHYIRGLFDGDGCVQRLPSCPLHCSVCSASRDYLHHVRELCGNIGTISKTKSIWEWRMSSYESFVFRDIIYGSGGFSLSRKRILMNSVQRSDLLRLCFTGVEKEQIRQRYERGDSVKSIAAESGRNPILISRIAQEFGIGRYHRPQWTPEERDYLRHRFDKLNPRESCQQIAAILQKTESSVNHMVTRLGLRGLRKRKRHV